jgi:CHRD domain-containing protein
MKKLGLYGGLVAVLLFAAGAYAVAGSGSERKSVSLVTLIGYLEAPSISTNAVGSFEATIDDEAREIHYTLSYSGLEGDVRQAHIHFAQRSVSGGISAWLCETTFNVSPTPTTPDCVQSGRVRGTIKPNDVIGPTGQGIAAGEFDELVEAIRAGRAYANVHSSKFPGGEIRAQLNDDDQRDD